jgi:hypothetical protein
MVKSKVIAHRFSVFLDRAKAQYSCWPQRCAKASYLKVEKRDGAIAISSCGPIERAATFCAFETQTVTSHHNSV